MPKTPKKTPMSGSILLGHELRRLRAGRTRREIVAMTTRPPLAGFTGSLSEAGLCEIESGKSMPTLATLHALSLVYRTSMTRLMAHVTEERVSSDAVAPGAATLDAFSELMGSGEWLAALRLAAVAEREAPTPGRRCQDIFPLLSVRSPLVVEYERMSRARS